MKCVFIFFISENDPNGKEYNIKNVKSATSISENASITIFINDSISIDLAEAKNCLIINNEYKNIMHALKILIEQYKIP